MLNKDVEILIKEIDIEFALTLEPGIQILIYNPLTSRYSVNESGKGFKSFAKHAYSGLKYFLL